MTDAEVLEVIQKAVRSETGQPELVVTTETTAADVEGWDSVAHGLIMLTIEVELGVRIDIDKTYAATKVGELIPVFREAIEAGK